MNLNLGCCDGFVAGYLNVDIIPPADVLADLDDDWPWADSSVDRIRADDVIEHLWNPAHTMNEAWRVLRPSGRFDIFVPTTDGRGAFQDHTHVSFWNRNSFLYYTDGVPERERFGHRTGVRARFRVLREEETWYPDGVHKLAISLEAVK